MKLTFVGILTLTIKALTVCGTDNITYTNVTEARVPIMHCEACGHCSNSHDIDIYNKTRNNLTRTTTNCAYLGLIGGPRRASHCMEKNVGFTNECNRCWVENIMCDVKKCSLKCIKCRLGFKCDVVGGLDACLKCDEDLCGPAFKECAGANRRRSGIKSDIVRPEEQICTIVGQLGNETVNSEINSSFKKTGLERSQDLKTY